VINSKFNGRVFSISAVLIVMLSIISFGQTKEVKPKIIYNQDQKQMNVADKTNLYCAGFITTSPVKTNFEIVGGDDESEQNIYSQGDFIYINQGANNGVKVGDMFAVIRPAGKVKTRSNSKGKLGIYVQELGAIEVVKVNSSVAVAKVKSSCDHFLLGDLVEPIENRSSLIYKTRPTLDVFAEPNGKKTGKIVMSKDGREILARDQIAFVDLGAEDNVSVGDYLTLYHPLGKGGVLNSKDDETVNLTDEDYGSKVFRGTDFSILGTRKSGNDADGKVVTTNDARKNRPAGLRKVVGEAVVLRVNEKTATILIIRNTREIHTGDMVEIQ
jgi:hypothetical protein